METKTFFSLCVYTSEYNTNQLNYIKENFIVIDEIETRLTIRGRMKELEKVMQAAFTTDEQFKQIFPLYQTAEERAEEINELFNELVEEVRTTLVQAIKLGCDNYNNEMYKIFSDFYFANLYHHENHK